MHISVPQVAPMSEDDIAEYKRMAAIHEAGHGVTALKLGAARVTLTLTRVVGAELKGLNPYKANCSAGGLLGEQNVAAYCYSGALAELLDDYIDLHPDNAWNDISNFPSMSRKDKKGTEMLIPELRRDAFDLSYDLLRANWAAVMGVAFCLHEFGIHDVYPSALKEAKRIGCGDFKGIWRPLGQSRRPRPKRQANRQGA